MQSRCSTACRCAVAGRLPEAERACRPLPGSSRPAAKAAARWSLSAASHGGVGSSSGLSGPKAPKAAGGSARLKRRADLRPDRAGQRSSRRSREHLQGRRAEPSGNLVDDRALPARRASDATCDLGGQPDIDRHQPRLRTSSAHLHREQARRRTAGRAARSRRCPPAI